MDKRSITSKENGKKGGAPKLYKTRDWVLVQNIHEEHALQLEEFFGKTYPRIVHALNQLFELGMKQRNVEALKTYLNRVAGMPRQQVDVKANVSVLKIDL